MSSEEQKETEKTQVLNNQCTGLFSAEIWESWRCPFLSGLCKCKSCNNKSEKHQMVVAVPEPEGKGLDGVAFVIVVASKGTFVRVFGDDVFAVESLDNEIVDVDVALVGSPMLLSSWSGL